MLHYIKTANLLKTCTKCICKINVTDLTAFQDTTKVFNSQSKKKRPKQGIIHILLSLYSVMRSRKHITEQVPFGSRAKVIQSFAKEI